MVLCLHQRAQVYIGESLGRTEHLQQLQKGCQLVAFRGQTRQLQLGSHSVLEYRSDITGQAVYKDLDSV